MPEVIIQIKNQNFMIASSRSANGAPQRSKSIPIQMLQEFFDFLFFFLRVANGFYTIFYEIYIQIRLSLHSASSPSLPTTLNMLRYQFSF